MREIEQEILKIFYDSSNRPKITPRHEAAIEIILKNHYSPRQVQDSLNNLEELGKSHSTRYRIPEVGFSKFYFLTEFNKKIPLNNFHFDELLNQILHLTKNSIFFIETMIKFDKPIQTKSGFDISEIWNELQECWAEYRKAQLDRDYKNASHYASRIQQLQNDIGLKQAGFPELIKSSVQQ